ncbi:MAG: hypothetical protein R3C49_15470 [Planctomycetaceae bacterium]
MNQPVVKSCQPADPLAQAREIRLTLRSDLHVSRQLSHGQPVYVIHDPITFRTHRLTAFQYRVLAELNPDINVGQNFRALVEKGEFETEEESVFFELLNAFSRLGMVVMPGQNGAKLFEQHQKMRGAKRRGRLLGFLFMQVPLVKPDRFLRKTLPWFSWLYTKAFFVVWLFAMAAAGFVIFSRYSEFKAPLSGILATKNLPFLWLSFVVLKIWHELGHGYACRKFGGYVPEMGTILIAGTPAAFVDATAAWSFPERWKRLVVMCGGMFFESLVFIPAVFVWAFSASPMLASCAHQLVVMAGLVTILFNANPLMRFDGYFILSELLGIQNLRPRADAQIKRLLSAGVLGIQHPATDNSRFTQTMLVLYGISATIYKFTLVISIAVVIAMKFPLVGLGLAAFHVSTSVGFGALKMADYLLNSRETQPVRGRARLVAAIVLIGLPVLACVVPVPFGVVVQGLVGAETEHFLNVNSPGVFQQAMVRSGDEIPQATPIVELKNDRLVEELQIVEANLAEATLKWQVLQQRDLAEAAQQQAMITELRQQREEIQRRVQRLTLTAPGAGRVVSLIPATERGRFLHEGAQIAVLAEGQPLLRTWLNEDQLGSVVSDPGTDVQFHVPGRPTETFHGQIVKVEPAAEEVFDKVALTYVTGGEILVNPSTGRPLTPLFQVDIQPSSDAVAVTEHGRRVNLQLPRRYESVAAWVLRRCTTFARKLLVA